jgi:hypothetical protein
MVNFKEMSVGKKVVGYFKGDSKPEVQMAIQKYMVEYPFHVYRTVIDRQGDNPDGGYWAHTLRLKD